MLVGRPLPRREDERILRGRTRYVDDIAPDGLLHIAFVRSPHARARILRIEAPGRRHHRRPTSPCGRCR